MLKEILEEVRKNNMSAKFAKATGLTKDDKNIGNGDVFFLKDGSSVVIYPDKSRIEYYTKDMEFVTAYTTVNQAVKALDQEGIL